MGILNDVSRAFLWKPLLRALILGKTAFIWGFAAGCLDSAYVLQEGETGQGHPAGGKAASCGETFRPGTDLAVCVASYWGTGGPDLLHAAWVTPTGEVFLGGQAATPELGVPTFAAAGSTTGVVLRVASGDGQLLSAARVAAKVNAITGSDDALLVASDLGVTRLSSDLTRVLAENALGEVSRIAASGSQVAILTRSGRVLLLDPDLKEQREFALGNAEAEDVGIDESTGLVLVTGSRAPSAGASCVGRLPFIRAYDEAGTLAWTAYDFDDAPGWCASSTGRRLAIKAGKLYYAGEQHGGNSVHLRDPRDPHAQATLVSYDDFSTGAGKAIQIYSFVARFELSTGMLEAGQVVVPREAGVGGTLLSSALAVDDAGRIFLGGHSSCCIEQRDARAVAGQIVGPFAGLESSLLVLSADLRERLAWTTFTGVAGPDGASIEGLAVGAGLAVVVASSDGSGRLLTVPASAGSPDGEGHGYFAILPAP